jgi:splicing factor 3B subunit 1
MAGFLMWLPCVHWT